MVVEVCFALMAAFMVLALVESYLVISLGVLLMAFGGSRWTKDSCGQHCPVHPLGRCQAVRRSSFWSASGPV